VSPKNPMTRPGIDPGTVRLVAQRLKHYATPDPIYSSYQRILQMYLGPPVEGLLFLFDFKQNRNVLINFSKVLTNNVQKIRST
jgi:hypothetical protein